MPRDDAKTWLKQKRKQGMAESASYAAAMICGGVFFLGLTFWIVFMLIKLMLLSRFPLSSFTTVISLLVASLVCGLIFVDSRNASRDDMSFLPLWLLREYIGVGPRMIREGWPHLARARRWKNFDLETCGNVLMFLAMQNAAITQGILLRAFPQLDWPRLVAELKLIPGVIFFQPDATRVTLTLPLRLQLRGMCVQARRASMPEPEPEPVRVNEPQKLSPAEILGVNAAASLAEIKIAYRTRIKECHPDHFATMDEQSRSLAEEWTKSLNAAYEILMANARARRQS